MHAPFDVLQHAARLRAAREPFVLATVTVSMRPTSARAGSRAVITRDGALFGWVGGACSQPAVVRQAQDVLQHGEPRVLRLSPEAGQPQRDGIIELPIACHSGGTLEIFLEPFLPDPLLAVYGDSPVATVLRELAPAFGFDARPGTAELSELEDAAFVVVATMGVDDEAALEFVLQGQPAYVGMVGSRRRFSAISDYLRSRGVPTERIERIRAPAGLDIHAETPQEIALSILAEMVLVRRTPASVPSVAPVEQAPNLVVDPICGMLVDLASARHTLEIDGQVLGFCCPACKRLYQQQSASG